MKTHYYTLLSDYIYNGFGELFQKNERFENISFKKNGYLY